MSRSPVDAESVPYLLAEPSMRLIVEYIRARQTSLAEQLQQQQAAIRQLNDEVAIATSHAEEEERAPAPTHASDASAASTEVQQHSIQSSLPSCVVFSALSDDPIRVPCDSTRQLLPSEPELLSSVSSSSPNANSLSSDDAFTPLLLLYGKPFAAAMSIILYNAEPIFRYRCYTRNSSKSSPLSTYEPAHLVSQGIYDHYGATAYSGRQVFQVGEHRLLGVYYCSCTAFHYAVLRRQETVACKHMLALRIALELEKYSGQNDIIRDKEVSEEEMLAMLCDPYSAAPTAVNRTA